MVEAAIKKHGTYIAGQGSNEKNRVGKEEKETQMRGQGIGIFFCDLHVYMRCIRSYSQKTPSPHLFHAPSVNMVIADVHRDAADAGDAPRTSSAGAVVAVEDELDASVCQAGDQRECDEPEHHKEGIRPSRLVGGGGRLRRRLAVDAFI